MNRRRLCIAVLVLGLVTLGVALYALKGRAVEQWYLWRLQSRDAEERHSAATGLADLKSEKAVPLLIELLLTEMGSRPGRMLLLDDFGLGAPYFEALVRLGRPAVPALSEMLSEEDFSRRYLATRILAGIGPPASDAAPILIEEFRRHPSNRVNTGDAVTTLLPHLAARAMKAMGRSAVAALEDALNDGDPSVRRHAVITLGLIGQDAEDAVSTVARRLEEDEQGVRVQAALTLGRIGPGAREAVRALTAALADPSIHVRESAATALERIGEN